MALDACGFFPDATFSLSSDSRLPSFLKLPPGQSRSDVVVSMSYYVQTNGRVARFVMSTSHGDTITKVAGKLSGLKPIVSPNSRNGYPSYEAITVGGLVEVIEHRAMEPIFYITDDAEVRRLFGAPTSNNRLEQRVSASSREGGVE